MNFYTIPKRNVVCEVFTDTLYRPRLRLRVIPSTKRVCFVVNHYVIIAGFTLPMAGGVAITRYEILLLFCGRWKIPG